MKKEGILGVKTLKSQITVFVIIALVIIGALAGYFAFKTFYKPSLPQSITPVYDYYLTCLQQTISDGASIMSSQAGYIYPPEFEPGSEYAPFSSQMAFMGFAVPYWYYISGNGVSREQIPTQSQMENQLARYVREQISSRCNFTNFRAQGYEITVDDSSKISSRATISDNSLAVTLNQNIEISYGEDNYIISRQSAQINSNLGASYNLARKIYDYWKTSMFIENYTTDVLYTYAPVEGFQLNCSPAIWSPYAVAERVKQAISANLGAVKIQGDYYNMENKYSSYFIAARGTNINVKNSQVRLLYSTDWPSRFEVWPTKNNLMIAEPVGTQQGLGAMGFCYVPYKFVYDLYFPVLVQIFSSDGLEIFEFPIAIVISKNAARESLPSTFTEQGESLCDDAKRNTELTISTYNVNLEPIEADIEFSCLDDACSLGKTKQENYSKSSVLKVNVPQCVNGFLTASSKGYKDKKYQISTNSETSADIVLDKSYNLNLEIYVDGQIVKDMAVLSMIEKTENSTSNSNSIVYPFNKNLELSEGNYDFDLKIYRSGSLTVPSSTTRQCVEVPKSGLLGLFGVKEEKCTDFTIPSQTISNVLSAGGKVSSYILPSQLENAKVMRVYATSIKTPSNLDEVQSAVDSIEGKSLNIEFA